MFSISNKILQLSIIVYNSAVIILHSNTFLIKSDPQVLLKISFAQNFDPQTLLKLTHKRYSKLLKISFTNVTQN